MIEGDILIDQDLKGVIDTALKMKDLDNYSRGKRNAIKYEQKKWQHAIVPYIFDESVGEAFHNVILIGLKHLAVP